MRCSRITGCREDILEQMTEEMDVMFLCNPNNPTGILVEQELLLRILERAESRSILLVLDECFLDLPVRKNGR